MEYPQELILRNKEITSDIITKFNQIENSIKEIITKYIASDKTEFIKKVLLNNLILNFSSKFKILQYIIANKEIEVDKNFNKSIKILMTNRNIIVHSDNLLDYNIISLKEDLFYSQVLKIPRYMSSSEKVESKDQITIQEGNIQNIEIEKIYSDFVKYFKIALKNIDSISQEF